MTYAYGFSRICAAALCWCLLALCGAAFAEGASESVTGVWDNRTADVDALINEIEVLRINAESMAGALTTTVMESRTQYTRLSSLFQASREHPTEQLTLAQQMRVIRDRLKRQAAPVENIAATVNGRLEDIAAMREDMVSLAKEDRQAGLDGTAALDPAEVKALRHYQSKLAEAESRLKAVSARVTAILAPARSMISRADASMASIEASMVDIWGQYYLAQSSGSIDALTATPLVLGSWAVSLESRMSFAYPQSASGWWYSARHFAISVFVFGLLGYLVWRGSRYLPARWRRAVQGVVRRAWVFCGLGLSVLVASANESGGIYLGFMLLGALLLIAGVASMSWKLRQASMPGLADKASPLNRIYPPAAIGVLMLFSDLPHRGLGLVWGLTMLLFLVFIFVRTRRDTDKGSLPLLERFSYNCALYFGLASLLVSLVGYGRLAILIFMLLFAMINIVTMDSALTGLFHILANRLVDGKKMPLRNSLLQAMTVPAAWLLSLICALPWLWAVPGARYMLVGFFSMDYKIGDASLDLSKGILILVLFFLFRSLAGLGKTSMEHLPEKMPHIERGVIPPLRNLLVYAIWVVFALVALGILGLNFTSLAVVAGGLSVGIGFGMQNIFSNLVSGLMLIFGRTILVGDYIDVGGISGTVKEISIRSTVVETSEMARVYVPNSTIMSGQFTNWTRGSRMVRRTITVGVAYGTDTGLVTRILLEVADKNGNVFKNPPPAVLFSNFGDSSLDFSMNVFLNLDNALSTLSDLRFAVEKAFAEYNIDIPFPQVTMHMVQPEKAPTA